MRYFTLAFFERPILYLCLYFTSPTTQKRTGKNLKALQLVTIGQNRSTKSGECHTLNADLLFSPKKWKAFCFCLWLCWVCVCVCCIKTACFGVGFLCLSGQLHFSRSAAWVLRTFPSACPLEFQLHGFWRLSKAEPWVTFGVFFLSHLALTPTPLTYIASILPRPLYLCVCGWGYRLDFYLTELLTISYKNQSSLTLENDS